jgi:putative component of membrane protein insertase Oxa1/YidC/SpoIIIJ protein YidD
MRAIYSVQLILLDLIIVNYIIRKVQVMKALIMQFYTTSCYFIPLSSKYSSQHTVLYTLSLCSSLNDIDQVSHPYKTTGK